MVLNTADGWVPYADHFSGKVMAEQMKPPFDLILGRKTYEIWASYWPHHSQEWLGINEARKYVASHEEMKFEWKNSFLLEGNVVEAIKKLKAENGPKLLVYGSGNLTQTLMKHDLVDEFWLKIYPITLGKGKRLFAEGTILAAFKLSTGKVSLSGVIIANYERAGEVRIGSF